METHYLLTELESILHSSNSVSSFISDRRRYTLCPQFWEGGMINKVMIKGLKGDAQMLS